MALLATPSNVDSRVGNSGQSLTVTTSGAGYVTGDVIGGILEFPGVNGDGTGRPVTLRSISIRDKNGNAIAMEVYFFKATPAAGTYTDSGLIAWGTGDHLNFVGSIAIASADWLTSNSQSFVAYRGLGMKLPVVGTSLFAIVLAKGIATLANGNFSIDAQFDFN